MEFSLLKTEGLQEVKDHQHWSQSPGVKGLNLERVVIVHLNLTKSLKINISIDIIWSCRTISIHLFGLRAKIHEFVGGLLDEFQSRGLSCSCNCICLQSKNNQQGMMAQNLWDANAACQLPLRVDPERQLKQESFPQEHWNKQQRCFWVKCDIIILI